MLRRVFAANNTLPPVVTVPPGDDLAQLVTHQGPSVLIGVDQLVAGRHYDPATTEPKLIGRKAVARSLSDVAAMAARPLATVVATTLPPDFGEAAALELFEGMRRTGLEFESPLVGGDLAIHQSSDDPLIAAVTVLAEPTTPRPVTRGGVQPGDGIYVTGALGGSLPSGRHLTFTPRIREGIELAALLGPRLHAMIDISDGLGADLGHLARASGVSIEIQSETLPLHPNCNWQQAVGDGEDYELCFAARGEVPERLHETAITRIGCATAGEASVCAVVDGRGIDVSERGWEHRA